MNLRFLERVDPSPAVAVVIVLLFLASASCAAVGVAFWFMIGWEDSSYPYESWAYPVWALSLLSFLAGGALLIGRARR